MLLLTRIEVRFLCSSFFLAFVMEFFIHFILLKSLFKLFDPYLELFDCFAVDFRLSGRIASARWTLFLILAIPSGSESCDPSLKFDRLAVSQFCALFPFGLKSLDFLLNLFHWDIWFTSFPPMACRSLTGSLTNWYAGSGDLCLLCGRWCNIRRRDDNLAPISLVWIEVVIALLQVM